MPPASRCTPQRLLLNLANVIGQTIAHYRILEKIGEGGMGIVYKAEDTKLRRIAALKCLRDRARNSDEFRARFTREAQAAGALDHPNICSGYELGEADGQLFLAMAYIEGHPLSPMSLTLRRGAAVPKAVQRFFWTNQNISFMF